MAKKKSMLFAALFLLAVLMSNAKAMRFVYQENVTAINYTGSWSTPVFGATNTYDGDFSTYGLTTSGVATVYFNYSVPAFANRSTIWTIKDGTGSANLSIPVDCWNETVLQFNAESIIDGANSIANWSCWNRSLGNWSLLRTGSGGTPAYRAIYEEAVYWALPDLNTSLSFNVTPIFQNDNNITLTYNLTGPLFNATCNITVNGDYEINGSVFNSTNTEYTFEFMAENGRNNVSIKCSEFNGPDFNETFSSERIAVTKFILVNESNDGMTNLSIGNTSIIAYAVDRNINFTFDDDQEWIYFVTNETDTIRFEIKYSGVSDIISRGFNMNLITENETRVCVANQQTFYEQIAYSSQTREVAMYSVYADCYILNDYTRYAYSDALMVRGFTIPTIYYLYTISNGDRTTLADIDGGLASEINLDLIEFSKRTYDISILTEDVSISAVTNTSIMIYYRNSKDESDETVITIYNGSTVLWTYTETATPNEMTVYFDHSSINLTDTLMKLEVETFLDGESLGTITRLLYSNGVTGFLDPKVAILLSAVLLFFSLSFVAIRYTFGFFGIIASFASLAILSQAPSNSYVILMEVIEVIVLLYIVILFKEEYAKVT